MSHEPTASLSVTETPPTETTSSPLVLGPDDGDGEELAITVDTSFEAERAVGITEFINAENQGFAGILKHRYSDFRVTEIDLDGELALIGESLCDPALLPSLDGLKEEGTVTASAKSSQTSNGPSLEQVKEALGPALKDEKELPLAMLELFHTDTREAAGKQVQTGSVPDKALRTAIHQTIRGLFGGILQTESSSENTIRIYRRGSEPCRGRGRQDGPRDDRNSKPLGQHRFLRLVLHKENLDTIDAIQLISRRLHLSPRDLSYAGTKDKRGVTRQWLVARNVTVAKVLGINKLLPGEIGGRRLQVGNVQLATRPLSLGDLSGNRFELVIRDVRRGEGGSNWPGAETDAGLGAQCMRAWESLVGVAVESLATHGFINYYGLQRFGTSRVASHAIGVALLRGDYEAAINLILGPRQDEGDARAEAARRHWQETGDASASQHMFPSRYTAERQILAHFARGDQGKSPDYLGAIRAISRELRLMYVHSVQSLVWNRMVSLRACTLGLKPVVGDLVLPHHREGAYNAPDTDDAADHRGHGRAGPHSPILLTPDNVQRYRLQDVVMPTPGYASIYPTHAVGAERYREELTTLLGAEVCPTDAFRPSLRSLWDLPGAYRHIVVVPNGVTHQLGRYSEPDVDLPAGFIAPLVPPRAGEETSSTAAHLGLVLSFSLPTSAYATMALRELMHAGTDPRHHKQRTKRHRQQ